MGFSACPWSLWLLGNPRGSIGSRAQNTLRAHEAPGTPLALVGPRSVRGIGKLFAPGANAADGVAGAPGTPGTPGVPVGPDAPGVPGAPGTRDPSGIQEWQRVCILRIQELLGLQVRQALQGLQGVLAHHSQIFKTQIFGFFMWKKTKRNTNF